MRVKVKEHLEKQCQELNHAPQIENISVPNLGDDPIGITRKDSGAFLSVKLDANRHKVTFRSGEPLRFKYVVEVKPKFNGRDWWYADKDRSNIVGRLE